MEIAAGTWVGTYEVGRKLGEGGFGAVFVARDARLERDVALKFLRVEHTPNPLILQRFLQEARSAARIPHPGIVTVYECGQVKEAESALAGTAFIAMEMLVGESVSARLERIGRLGAGAAVEIARQVASAVGAAHDAGIVHRDLKPDNIYLVRDPVVPGGERVKVLDFGIAKLVQADASTSGVHTASVMVFGTPRYMSPEQCKSAANADHRSDIYALGCILFELVTGQTPFQGEPGELIAKHQLEPAPTARSLAPDVPPAVDALIARLLAKRPADRPQTMAAVEEAIGACGVAVASGTAPTLMSTAPALPTPAGVTTLSTANGSTSVPAPRGRLGWKAGAGAAAVLGVGIAAFALLGRGGGSNNTPTTPATQPTAATAPAPAAAQAPAPAPPAPTPPPTPPPPPPVTPPAPPVKPAAPPPVPAPPHVTTVIPHPTPPAPPPPTPATTGTGSAAPAPAAKPCTPVKDSFVDPFHPSPCPR